MQSDQTQNLIKTPGQMIAEFCFNPAFKVPSDSFIYSAVWHTPFSLQGETLVQELIKVTPAFFTIWSDVVPVEVQVDTIYMYISFNYLKKQIAKSGKLEKGSKVKAEIATFNNVALFGSKPRIRGIKR